jgi:pyrroloquinoline quinone (PQQ) biosynthesis protein C
MDATQTTFLNGLARELEQHPVNCNPFFEAFRDRYLSDLQLRTFLGQYQYFCKHFVKLLEMLLYRTPIEQLEMRIELLKTLYSELGAGRVEKAHIRLLNRFARAVGLSEAQLEQTTPIPEVATYLLVLRRLFGEAGYLTALGAELAVEMTAASEFRYFYPGLVKYQRFQEDELEFFKLHLQEEQDHSNWLLAAVRKTAHSAQDEQQVAAGARQTAAAWGIFWDGMYRTVFGDAASRREQAASEAG